MVLDIEGTVTPISFVKQTLFPYAQQGLVYFLNAHAHLPDVQECIREMQLLVRPCCWLGVGCHPAAARPARCAASSRLRLKLVCHRGAGPAARAGLCTSCRACTALAGSPQVPLSRSPMQWCRLVWKGRALTLLTRASLGRAAHSQHGHRRRCSRTASWAR